MTLTATPDGVLLVDKAAGMTSHDVVALVRRQLQIKKVGHCGTLDPIATGLLILTLGRGTKIQDLIMSEDKEYVGTLKLGETTDSQDAQGQVTETRPVQGAPVPVKGPTPKTMRLAGSAALVPGGTSSQSTL
jgi:tRNA pseudouridine55 synthase